MNWKKINWLLVSLALLLILSSAQARIILAKHEELRAEKQANWESLKNMSPEERHESMQSQREELESWAEANGIDLSFFRLGKGRFGHGRFGFGSKQ